MANTYFDLTGVLRLKEVTPIIKAVFGGLKLDPDEPGNGEVYFALLAEDNNADWDGIITELETYAVDVGAVVANTDGSAVLDDDSSGTAETVLAALAKHFKVEQDEDLEALIEQCDFTNEAALDALFTIAHAFDDGHGLESMRFEGAYHSDRPRLFEFGGHGNFTSKHLCLGGGSREIMDLGEQLSEALDAGDTFKAGAALRDHVGALLAAFANDDHRTQARLALSNMLLSETPPQLNDEQADSKPSSNPIRSDVTKVYIEAYDSAEYSDEGPRFALVLADQGFIDRLRRLQAYCAQLGLSEVRVVDAPQLWGGCDENLLRLQAPELVVGSRSFWFVDLPKNVSHTIQTRSVDIDAFIAAVDSTPPGTPAFLGSNAERLRELVTEADDDAVAG